MFYDYGAANALKTLGFRKEARFAGKDFLAGIDPTGTFTTSYGVEDAGAKDTRALGAGAVGAAGGVLGGGLLVPSSIYGLVNAPAGYAKGKLPGAAKAFWKGFKQPIQSVVQGGRGIRALSQAKKEGLTAEQVQRLNNLWKTTEGHQYQQFMQSQMGKQVGKAKKSVRDAAGPASGVADKGVEAVTQQAGKPQAKMEATFKRYLEEGMTPEEYKNLSPVARKFMTRELRSAVSTGASQIGLAGLIGGGSAGLQYSKGRELGSYMTPEKRQEYLDS